MTFYWGSLIRALSPPCHNKNNRNNKQENTERHLLSTSYEDQSLTFVVVLGTRWVVHSLVLEVWRRTYLSKHRLLLYESTNVKFFNFTRANEVTECFSCTFASFMHANQVELGLPFPFFLVNNSPNRETLVYKIWQTKLRAFLPQSLVETSARASGNDNTGNARNIPMMPATTTSMLWGKLLISTCEKSTSFAKIRSCGTQFYITKITAESNLIIVLL